MELTDSGQWRLVPQSAPNHVFSLARCFFRLPPLFSLVPACIILFLFCASGNGLAQDATLFLPLKINTQEEPLLLRNLADKALSEALHTHHITEATIYPLERSKAEKEVDYEGTWPPSADTLRALADRNGGRRYVAAGSLTRLGRQISIDVRLFDSLEPAAAKYYYQNAQSPEALDQAMDRLIGAILADTAPELLIADIVIKGNERIDSGAIRRQIQIQPGDRFDQSALRDDLKRVFKLGYFDDVQVDVNDTKKGKEVIFEVKEKPVIGQVLIEGTKELEEKTVRDAISVAPNTIINPTKLKESIDSIKALYKEKGFYDTTVDAKLSYPKPERVDIRFIIEEGPKIYTKEVRFVGNKAYDAKKLRKIIQTSVKGFFSWITESGLLKRDVLEQDVARIAAFYHNNGYIEAKVGEPEIVQEGKWLYVTFNIYEGDRYKVGKVDLTGELIADKSTLFNMLKISKEEYLSRKILRDDILRLTDYYAENGYAFAEVSPSIKEDKEGKKVDIVINIQKGGLVYINRIIIKGNTRTRDKVIRREMVIKEKGIFNSKALRTSHDHLMRLDYFEDVRISPEESPLDKNLMDVTVDVKEKPTGAFSIGAGYSSVENLMLMGEISQNNFLGKGQRLAFAANLSSITNRYNISFTEPHYKDSQLLVGTDLYNWKHAYDDYTKESYGGAIRFGYPIWREWKMGCSYGYDNADLTDVSVNAAQVIKDSVDLHVTSYVTLGFSRDTRDRRYDASKGSINSLSTKYAGGPLGGDSAFTKIEISSGWYFPLFWDTVYHLKGVAGQVFENKGGKLPVFEKFYLGGIRTIRGFPSNRISPIDPVSKERIGGEKMWYMNAELIFPLARQAGLKGVIFFDAGNVYDKDWDFNEIKKSVGGGFRWLSPMGPLRLEWGYVIDPVGDEEHSNWDFSIGAEF